MKVRFESNLKFVRKITSTLELHRAGNTFALLKNEKVQGWVSFRDTLEIIHEKKYYVAEFIYLNPGIRKGVAGGAFMIAFKQELDHPFIIGTEADYGGVLFVDGVSLINAMNTSSKFDVKVLNFKTGDVREYDPSEELGTGVTLVVEQENQHRFPFFNKTVNMYIYEDCENRNTL